ncbi:hypothetical protein F4779DRAFT_637503 [Xylariaceae sp. FL0662B]|nr:hypothetical protein F4779DRAFT_637503 [Xylariaceae sp. FL0662B]
MPPEVISLLSSSPSVPSPPVSVTSPKPPSRTNAAVPSRALDYDVLDVTADLRDKTVPKPPIRISNAPITVPKRTSSSHRQNDDFLFLSDEFDTTGDLGGSAAKRRRVSPTATSSKRSEGSTFKRTKSATAGNLTSELHVHESTGLKRWNSAADPIEHSSSPNGITATRNQRAPNNKYTDPFDSPPRKQATGERSTLPVMSNMSSDPFGSSPIRGLDNHRASTQSRIPRIPSDDSIGSSRYPGNKQPPKASEVVDLSDELFISSPPRKMSKQKAAWDPISSSMPEAKGASSLIASADSDSDLPELGDIDVSKIMSRRRSYSLSPSTSKKPKAVKKPAKKDAESKESERQRKAEAREAERERKRVEKERAKEQRAIEKQREKALIEVNKLRTDKKVSTPEMIVDLPTTLNAEIRVRLEMLLGQLGVRFENYQSRVDNVVKWRRKVASKFNEDLGHWEPIPMHIRNEDHVLVVVQAPEFVNLVHGSEGQDLEAHVLKMNTAFPDTKIIYLIEGLEARMRKNRNMLNRQFASAVRGLYPDGGDPGPSSTNSSQRRNNAQQQQQEPIDEDMIEDALLSLQVAHGALIHHTHAAVETAQWVAAFTQHISTIPYRRARFDATNNSNFCMEAGQVRTGDGPADTYVRMLQEIARVTAPVAHGVAAAYPSVAALVRGLERDGPRALEHCRKKSAGAGRDAAFFTDRAVGPAVSRRLYKIFTCRDPESMDV